METRFLIWILSPRLLVESFNGIGGMDEPRDRTGTNRESIVFVLKICLFDPSNSGILFYPKNSSLHRKYTI